jgi:hypothetical protein
VIKKKGLRSLLFINRSMHQWINGTKKSNFQYAKRVKEKKYKNNKQLQGWAVRPSGRGGGHSILPPGIAGD